MDDLGQLEDTQEIPAARLFCLIAREVRKAVIFRRGPGKVVRLLSWNLKTDEITPGQWLKGRIYERRSDLSPDGELLVYFAGKFRGPLYAYTVVSRPPWLTALALFDQDHTWGGGGNFLSNKHLLLNQFDPDPAAQPHSARLRKDKSAHSRKKKKAGSGRKTPKYQLKKQPAPWETSAPVDATIVNRPAGHGEVPGSKLQISYLDPMGYLGEDEPLLSRKYELDGWIIQNNYQRGEPNKNDNRFRYPYNPPFRRSKTVPDTGYSIQIRLHGVGAREGGWYYETLELVDEQGSCIQDIGRVDWADLDHNGDLLIATNGILTRYKVSKENETPLSEGVVVADLNDMRFSSIVSPMRARKWP